jgi:hypothetical protein
MQPENTHGNREKNTSINMGIGGKWPVIARAKIIGMKKKKSASVYQIEIE